MSGFFNAPFTGGKGLVDGSLELEANKLRELGGRGAERTGKERETMARLLTNP